MANNIFNFYSLTELLTSLYESITEMIPDLTIFKLGKRYTYSLLRVRIIAEFIFAIPSITFRGKNRIYGHLVPAEK